jgi:hypothetical protein
MILDEPTALRLFKLMKLQVPPPGTLTVLGEQKFSFTAYSGSGLPETTKASWRQDGDSSPPYNILLRRERADTPPLTEHYTSCAGFAQAYWIKAPWKD